MLTNRQLIPDKFNTVFCSHLSVIMFDICKFYKIVLLPNELSWKNNPDTRARKNLLKKYLLSHRQKKISNLRSADKGKSYRRKQWALKEGVSAVQMGRRMGQNTCALKLWKAAETVYCGTLLNLIRAKQFFLVGKQYLYPGFNVEGCKLRLHSLLW